MSQLSCVWSGSSWQIWAVLSAIFAALTAIFAKVGVENVNSDLATFIRTIVVISVLAFIVYVTRQFQNPADISARTYLFLLFSGLGTGASWLCYFRALKLGNAAQVAPIDKLSVVLVAIFGVIFLGEKLAAVNWLGVALVAAGAILVAVGERLNSQRLFQRQEIAPGETLLQRAAQQKRRMEGRHRADFARAGVVREPAPARRVMPSLMPSSVCIAGPPRQTRKSGLASSIWRRMKGRQIAVSCGVGVRLPGGRHGTTLAI